MVPFSEADIPGKMIFSSGTATQPFTSSSPLCLCPAGLVRTSESASRFSGNS